MGKRFDGKTNQRHSTKGRVIHVYYIHKITVTMDSPIYTTSCNSNIPIGNLTIRCRCLNVNVNMNINTSVKEIKINRLISVQQVFKIESILVILGDKDAWTLL